MIQKYSNGKPTYNDDFDYILVSNVKIEGDRRDAIVNSAYSANDDIVLLFGKQGLLTFIYGILIKLSLSVKRGKMLPFGTVYSRNAYDYLISKNLTPEPGKNMVLGNAMLLKNRSFQYNIVNTGIICRDTITFGDFLDLTIRRGNMFKYVLVGISGVIVNEAILLMLHGIIGRDLSILPAIEISIIWNFILNNKFTFGGRGHFYMRLAKYNAFNLIGFGANLGVYYSALFYKTNIYVADFLGILVAFIITYTTATLIVW
ncbi:MAG: GtrA family protein [Ferroplasma sp.]|uniref:GtrA family protein n=1 Tax=Ferroplasma sp. TaxID=2591003 RepID=UPI00281663F8|nr:GtrA family protein [Ferroplasma sp.]WMT51024.1 MAG: GtrA family protein [Ferroplasma sp.]